MEKNEGFVRLGKRELGRYAFEKQMPEQVAKLLDAETNANELSGVLPKLAHLLEHDRGVAVAYLCDEAAVQIYKLRDEGAHFCGYRNLQMLCLAVGSAADVRLTASHKLKEKLTVPRLQTLLEEAWSQGFNSHGRVLTGGIKGTRKHIGTSEAEAVLLSMHISCTGSAFEGKLAWRDLLDFIEAYFKSSIPSNSTEQGIHKTSRPPIFLQRPNHSITVVGIERGKFGKRCLLAFDPAWKPPSKALSNLQTSSDNFGMSAKWVLFQYRKSERYLRRFRQFETLTVDQPARIA